MGSGLFSGSSESSQEDYRSNLTFETIFKGTIFSIFVEDD
jgi:hypothetical protein